MNRGSKSRLTERSLHLFEGDTLFDEIGRTVCNAACLPRKELFEAWEVARRVRRRLRGGRVVDLCCGHGLLAYIMLLLDDSSPSAVAVDKRIPQSASKLAGAIEARWPRVAGRVERLERSIASFELAPGDVVVSAHACGSLTDDVLTAALQSGAHVAVLPCCQSSGKNDLGRLDGWLADDLAIDVTRAARLRSAGYRIWTQAIPAEVSPKNRLLIGRKLD